MKELTLELSAALRRGNIVTNEDSSEVMVMRISFASKLKQFTILGKVVRNF